MTRSKLIAVAMVGLLACGPSAAEVAQTAADEAARRDTAIEQAERETAKRKADKALAKIAAGEAAHGDKAYRADLEALHAQRDKAEREKREAEEAEKYAQIRVESAAIRAAMSAAELKKWRAAHPEALSGSTEDQMLVDERDAQELLRRQRDIKRQEAANAAHQKRQEAADTAHQKRQEAWAGRSAARQKLCEARCEAIANRCSGVTCAARWDVCRDDCGEN